MSDRIESVDYTGNNEDGEVVSQVMNEVQAAIGDSQVSSKVRTCQGSKLCG